MADINDMSTEDRERLMQAAEHCGAMADRAVLEGTVGAETDAVTAWRDFQSVAREILDFDVAELVADCVYNVMNHGPSGY